MKPGNGALIAVLIIGGFVAAIGVVIVAAAAFGAFFYVANERVPVHPPVAVPAMTSAQVSPPTITGAAPAAPTNIRSIPEGAEVVRDGIVVCHTPCELSAAEGEELSLELRLDGYETHTMTVTAGGMAGVKLVPKAP